MSPVSVKPALLIALSRHGEGYGLQLIEWLREDTGGGLDFAQGLVYPALRQLETDGFVRSRTGEPRADRGGRPRVYYRLTRKGTQRARDDMKAIASITGLALEGA